VKVGDLIRFRSDWNPGNGTSPRTDDEDWSNPVLVVERWEGMWICLEHGVRIVVNPNPGTVAVEVISENR